MSRQDRIEKRPSKLLLVGGLILAGLVAACDETEQGRPLQYEKGVYQGAPDTSLTQEQLNELRQRSRLQSGS